MDSESPPDLTQNEPTVTEAPKIAPKIVKKPSTKPVPPKKEITKKINDFASLLKNLTPDAAEKKPEEEGAEAASESSQLARFSDRLTMSEEDALRHQLSQCWNVLAGAKYAEDLVVQVRVVVNPDRTVQRATIINHGLYNRDSHYKAAADAAIRALRNPRCTPLALPPDKYEEWKVTIIRFDPREML